MAPFPKRFLVFHCILKSSVSLDHENLIRLKIYNFIVDAPLTIMS